ncbi:hypothetical protein [Planosporangium mesophilum]|uniref:Glycerophosphoryl diester phosphodiesterase membrane domain-containing protein n=1 Tax=Planosporangium mesophilum TaxID=689768 RepID=A0A8J3X190_9ACTN|nr:hypothetical protein [Planosporangium mesophilum]NJC84959.1 hypothetical protein [Planosporangium mesophilum]GII23571.1 hypothetical protein Pme01_31680 [Planosporangium mesophilum]
MQPSRPPGVIPLRPLTLGELLDTAIELLRRNAVALLLAGPAVAAAEQAVLYPLRAAAAITPPGYLPHGRLGGYWLVIAAGFATEAVVIALLGGLAARAAASDLLGEHLPARRLLAPTGSRFGAVAVVALVAGLAVGVCTVVGLVPWVIGYGLVGLAVPTLVIDRYGVGRALLRSARLSVRAGMRAASVRVAGYLAWLAIRAALTLGGPFVLYELFPGQPWLPGAVVAIAVAVNGVAYPALACLDAVLHLETRMRTEGLDIWLARALRPGAAEVGADLPRVLP